MIAALNRHWIFVNIILQWCHDTKFAASNQCTSSVKHWISWLYSISLLNIYIQEHDFVNKQWNDWIFCHKNTCPTWTTAELFINNPRCQKVRSNADFVSGVLHYYDREVRLQMRGCDTTTSKFGSRRIERWRYSTSGALRWPQQFKANRVFFGKSRCHYGVADRLTECFHRQHLQWLSRKIQFSEQE